MRPRSTTGRCTYCRPGWRRRWPICARPWTASGPESCAPAVEAAQKLRRAAIMSAMDGTIVDPGRLSTTINPTVEVRRAAPLRTASA